MAFKNIEQLKKEDNKIEKIMVEEIRVHPTYGSHFLDECSVNKIKRMMIIYANKKTKKLKREIKQWEETCKILANPEIKKSIRKSLKQFAEGKGIKIRDL